MSKLAERGTDWRGVVIQDQATANERIPKLLETPAAVRFVVGRGLTGPVDLTYWLSCFMCGGTGTIIEEHDYVTERLSCYCQGDKLGWVIIEGGNQPMHPGWVRSLRDQCVAAGVPFCFRGWGEWAPIGPASGLSLEQKNGPTHWFKDEGGVIVNRVGKEASGRMLDGQIWDQWPTDALTTLSTEGE